MNTKDTSWGKEADWYAEHLAEDNSYHASVVLPNLVRALEPKPGERILDLACGTGFFSKAFSDAGADVVGVDIGAELIEKAKSYAPKAKFAVAPSHELSMIEAASINKISLVLAIQNIKEVKETLAECKRVLKKDGKLFIVMNHPVFRIPQGSSWGWDPSSPEASKGHGEKTGKQYRRIDYYLSEKTVPITMHPGKKPSATTVSFHRSLQYYFKLLGNTGFAVTRLEEWISNRVSESGPRKKEEDRMRKEIPLFMLLEARVV